MLDLTDITICAADCLHPRLAARALELCVERCAFADAVLFTDAAVSGRFRTVNTGRITTIADYSRFCLRDLPNLVATPFVLVMQWDGYVVDASAWANAFRKYDFIGSPANDAWAMGGLKPNPNAKGPSRVGNGGFSLRSKRLLKALSQLPFIPGAPEDYVISSIYRTTLQQKFGIRFASLKDAERFSYEGHYPGRSTFGVHGLFNLWRHEPDDELVEIAEGLSARNLASWQFLGLIHRCLESGRFDGARRLFALARRHHNEDRLRAEMASFLGEVRARGDSEILAETSGKTA